MLTDTRKSPEASVQPLGSRNVQWTGGFWKDVESTLFQDTVPELKHMFDAPEISHVVENFRIAAGEASGDFDGTVFGDGDFYKWMEACMYQAVKTGDQSLLDQLDRYIDLIGRAQQPDGYLSTKQIIGERQHNGVRRMGDINDFEVYNFGHLFTAAALYYRLTGKENLLKIASKTADYLEKMYDEAERKGEIQTAVCPSHYMGLIELYRATGDQRYLDLAKKAIRLRSSVKHGLDDNQDRIPLRQHRRIIGHAVRANYLYAGVADLCLEEDDPELRTVLDSVWKDLVSHKMYITGGCGALYNGASPYGNFMDHQLIHQAYGYAYQLPNVTAYNETCAGIGLIMWAYRMFLLHPRAEYMDVLERAMLNTTLAAVSLDGLRFFYENMLERKKHLDYKLIWDLHRTNYITSYCCPPNLARCLAEATEYAYTVSREAGKENVIYTGLYGSSRADFALKNGTSFTLIQETGYPFDGRIRFRFENVENSAPVVLALRIPVWSKETAVSVSDGNETCRRSPGAGSMGENCRAGSYHMVEVMPSETAEVVLNLDMRVRFTAANPMVEEDQGKAAVERGPLVYCMETADTEEKGASLHISLDDLSLVFDDGKGPESFHPVEKEIQGRRLTALCGTMQAVVHSHGETGEDGEEAEKSGLYAEMRPLEKKMVPVQMLPYYAWDNRSEKADADPDRDDEMKIWFPVVR